MTISRPAPCGTCAACALAREVEKMLAFVDRRMTPAVKGAAQRIADLRWGGAGERDTKVAHREFARAKNEWLEQRAKILTAEVIAGSTCLSTYAVIMIREPEQLEPPEVDAIPAEVTSDDIRRALAGIPYLTVCFRCRGPLDYEPNSPLAVCARCFGKEPL